MKILHISEIAENLCNGMTAVVPFHVIQQSKFEDVYYLNLKNTKLVGFDKQITFNNNIKTEEFTDFLRQFDIVVFHGLYIIDYVHIGKILKSLSVPYVIVPHGSMTKYSQKKNWIKKLVANILYFNKFVTQASAIQFLSQGEADSNIFKCKKYFIGTNGIDFPSFMTKSERRGVRQISFIGRLDVFYKGLDFLIEAISINKSLFIEKNIHVSIYGNDIKGRGEQVKKIINNLKVNEIVSVNKEVLGDEKKEVLLNTDVFVLTSRSEGMPMGVLEALSYGIPCLVSEGTNLKELIDEYNAGWSCLNNTDSVCEALCLVLKEDYDLSVKSKNAQKLISDVFSWSIVAKNTVNYYHTLVE